jgi:glycosyltransferase involved in cell wall biosynthesis
MRDVMKVLCVHQNFPGQYLHLARHLGSQPGHQVVFITQRQDSELPGVRKLVYKPRRTISPQVHHYLRESEAAVLNAQEVARVALDLRKAGFIPDVMLGHNGWGEIWYLKDIFPEAPLIGYFEFFYRMTGADVGFDPADPVTPDTAPRLRTKNLGNLLALDTADLGQCPTEWQKSVYPRRYHSNLNVIHEGVDSAIARPDPTARILLANERLELRAGEEIVTYVARNLEPYRGFPNFMRSLPKILAARPKARVLIVGGDDVIVGSRTQPVQEVLHHGGNGLLVDFFSPDEIAERVIQALEDPRSFASLRQNARETVLDRYDLRSVCLPAHLRLLNMLVPREQRVSLQSVSPLMKATG